MIRIVPAVLAALFLMAASPRGPVKIDCAVGSTPRVSINPVSAPVKMDFSQPTAVLDRMRAEKNGADRPGMDMATGGLRVDTPKISTEMTWTIKTDTQHTVGCMWFDKVDVTISLTPHVYVAREFSTGACRDAVLDHEMRHVEVDRQVMNRYALDVGEAIKRAVDDAGAVGPFLMSDLEAQKNIYSAHIERVVNESTKRVEEEMARLQAEVDSPEEYKRVSAICQKEALGLVRPGKPSYINRNDR